VTFFAHQYHFAIVTTLPQTYGQLHASLARAENDDPIRHVVNFPWIKLGKNYRPETNSQKTAMMLAGPVRGNV
jgi:hypothetical protein